MTRNNNLEEHPAFIKNKKMLRAFNFARKLKYEGKSIGLANYISSKYYDVSQKELGACMQEFAMWCKRKYKENGGRRYTIPGVYYYEED